MTQRCVCMNTVYLEAIIMLFIFLGVLSVRRYMYLLE